MQQVSVMISYTAVLSNEEKSSHSEEAAGIAQDAVMTMKVNTL